MTLAAPVTGWWSPELSDSIHGMLSPASIAVIGATKRAGYGARMWQAALQAKDRVRVYPVNPGYEELDGFRCYPSVHELPEIPDVMGVVVPRQQVMSVLEAGQRKGVRAAVVVTAGFAERGEPEDINRQSQLSHPVVGGLRICGPNCMGVANIKDGIWVAPLAPDQQPRPGNVALISQSGALGFGTLLPRAISAGIGISYIISTGNEADLDFADYARYLLDDESTTVIAGYVEGFKDAKKFREVAKLAADRGKPLVLAKVGRADHGARAARSHTGAMAGSDSAYDALFAQYGVIRVSDYEELLEVAHLLALPAPEKTGIAVVSHSGGVSTMVADHLGASGFDLPELSARARVGIQRVVGEFGWAANPADVTRFAFEREDFTAVLEFLFSEPRVGTVVVASDGSEIQSGVFAEQTQASGKLGLFLRTGKLPAAGEADVGILHEAGIPVFLSPRALADGLRKVAAYRRWQDAWQDHRPHAAITCPSVRRAIRGPIAERLQSATGILTAGQALGLLESWGIPHVRQLAAGNAEEAATAAADLGFPVAVKLDSPDVAHKTDVGMVQLDLRDASAVCSAAAELLHAASKLNLAIGPTSIVVQEYITEAVEVIAGTCHDDQLGSVIMLGSGGVMVELYGDVTRRICPITYADAVEMIGEVRIGAVLRGFRGGRRHDIAALARALVGLSELAASAKGLIAEVDVNPIMVLGEGQGVRAVDALIISDANCLSGRTGMG